MSDVGDGSGGPPALEVSGLRAYYGSVEVLHGVALSVAPSEIVALVGPNGAGKTTLLRAVSGDVRVRGAIRYRDRSLAGRKPHVIARMGVGHIPEGRGTFTDLTVEDNLQLGCLAAGRAGTRTSVDEAYELFPMLRDSRNRLAGALSGGQQQMLAIARALLARPELLLVDEPCAGLAPKVSADVFDRLRGMLTEARMSVVLAEQNVTRAFALASRAYVMTSGRVAFSGRVDELRQRDEVRHAYLGTARGGGTT